MSLRFVFVVLFLSFGMLLLLHSIHQYTFSDSHINFYFHIHTKPLLWFALSSARSRFIFVGLTANYQFQMTKREKQKRTNDSNHIYCGSPIKAHTHTHTVIRCDNQWNYLLTKWFSGNTAWACARSFTLIFTRASARSLTQTKRVIINGNELKTEINIQMRMRRDGKQNDNIYPKLSMSSVIKHNLTRKKWREKKRLLLEDENQPKHTTKKNPPKNWFLFHSEFFLEHLCIHFVSFCISSVPMWEFGNRTVILHQKT